MSNLQLIARRHGWDRWTDAAFIGAALLLTALSIGTVTTQAVGTGFTHQWTVTVVDGQLEPGR